MKRIIEHIFNIPNLVSVIVLILGVFFMFVGSVKGLDEVCSHYNTVPDYNSIFTFEFKCDIKDKIDLCLLPVGDLNECKLQTT
jgi:uncharacterized membrane protein